MRLGLFICAILYLSVSCKKAAVEEVCTQPTMTFSQFLIQIVLHQGVMQERNPLEV